MGLEPDDYYANTQKYCKLILPNSISNISDDRKKLCAF